MKKTIASLLAVCMLAAGFVGCGTDDEPRAGSDPSQVSSQVSSQAEPSSSAGSEILQPEDVKETMPQEILDTVEAWSEDPDEFWKMYVSLPDQCGGEPWEESKELLLEWLQWFSAKSEEEQKFICYRPYDFGVIPKEKRQELMADYRERLPEKALRIVDEDTPDADKWWGTFYALPIRDHKTCQAEHYYYFEFAPETQDERWALSHAWLAITQDFDPSEEAKAQAALQDPAILKAVEEYTYDPDLWWTYFYRLPEEGRPRRAGRRQTQEWLDWFAFLPEEEVRLVNYHPLYINNSDGELSLKNADKELGVPIYE